jgi:hypothetical protein
LERTNLEMSLSASPFSTTLLIHSRMISMG